jgi:two-component system sensor histidine kinase/response regulator
MTTPPSGSSHSAALRVLLAEDTLLQEKLAVHLLEDEGHSVAVAHNGKEAVEAMEDDRFDLVFMDVQMPVMDGLEAASAIRRKEATSGEHTRVIAVTATADRDECLAAGMDGHIAKPLSASVLRQTIADMLGL